jgi:hypothetical protein
MLDRTRIRRGAEEHHPHACTGGLVYITYAAHNEEVGEEVEHLDLVPCRRCAETREDARGASRQARATPRGARGPVDRHTA